MDTNIMRLSLLAAVLAPTLSLAQSAPTSTHDCVAIVVDLSGSMEEEMSGGRRKIDAAKQALRVVVPQLPAATWVGIVVTPDEQWAYPLGPLDRAKLLEAINRLEINGGTPIMRHVKAGADRLMQERGKQFGYGSYRLLVVTDGQETENEGLVEPYAQDVRARGLTFDVIGVAMQEDHALKRYAHTYRDPADPASLERAVREVLAERVDSSDQTGGGDAFALVAGLDPGVAQAVITSLGKMPNHPIGEQPPVASTGGGGGSSSGAGGGGGGGGHSPTPPGCGGCVSAGGGVAGLWAWLVMGLLWAAIVLHRRRFARVRVRNSRDR